MTHTCDRCGSNEPLSMSYLNQDMLCPSCKTKEKQHPRYEEAKEIELAAVKSGNYNYPGLLAGEVIKNER